MTSDDLAFDFAARPSPENVTAGPDAVDFIATPEWFALAAIERYLDDLRDDDVVLDPCCGDGNFLKNIDSSNLAYGIEIDRSLAEEARRRSGREVIVGDSLAVDLPVSPTKIITNPPFRVDWLTRALQRFYPVLPNDGRGQITLLLPAYALQTSNRVCDYIEKYSMSVEMIPRDIFVGFDKPLVIATFTKDRLRRLVGIAFFQEVADHRELSEEFRAILTRSRTNVWVAACLRALERLGGRGSVDDIWRVISNNRPTRTQYGREAVRKHLRRHFPRIEHGVYALPTAA